MFADANPKRKDKEYKISLQAERFCKSGDYKALASRYVDTPAKASTGNLEKFHDRMSEEEKELVKAF